MTYECVLAPGDALGLVCVGVGEALDLTGLATEQAVQVGADLVSSTLFKGMALRASRLTVVSLDGRSSCVGMLAYLEKGCAFLIVT